MNCICGFLNDLTGQQGWFAGSKRRSMDETIRKEMVFERYLNAITEFKTTISKFWMIKNLREIGNCLGIKVTRRRPYESDYAKGILDQYSTIKAFKLGTLCPNLESLLRATENDEPANVNEYMNTIGSLMYLIQGSRPDLTFTVARLSQYCAKPMRKY